MPAKGQDIMATSLFLARLLGPLLIVVGASLLLNPKLFRAMAGEIVASVTLVYLFGIFDFTAGLAIVLVHNVWLPSWRLIITLLGWLLVLRGAVRVLATERMMRFAKPLLSGKNIYLISGLVCVGLGLVLCYFGYAA